MAALRQPYPKPPTPNNSQRSKAFANPTQIYYENSIYSSKLLYQSFKTRKDNPTTTNVMVSPWSMIKGMISKKKRGMILSIVALLTFVLSVITLSHLGDHTRMKPVSHANAERFHQRVLSIERVPSRQVGHMDHPIILHRIGSKYSLQSIHSRPLELKPNEELAAVVAFLAASSSNSFLPFIDPSKPLDPRLVLGFDTRRHSAADEIAALTRDTWKEYPVVLLSKLYSPVARELRTILASYPLKTQPIIWELDARQDSHVVIPLVSRLTKTTDLPILLVGGSMVPITESTGSGPAHIAAKLQRSDGAGSRQGGEDVSSGMASSTAKLLIRVKQLNDTGELRQLLVSAGTLKSS